ncbi:hypothetical protein ACFWBN_22040 [Streptomyces sp. NPDC059989]|uniref:hypothetical protein n=1 Tax=Streptomyces sp. NPDC059989 TaxID=3347026 RepID=UPI0036C99232
MTALASFIFVRHIDGLRHHFERDGERNGRPAYRRTDGNVWCVWSPTDGWHGEIADGLVTAHPVNSHADGVPVSVVLGKKSRVNRGDGQFTVAAAEVVVPAAVISPQMVVMAAGAAMPRSRRGVVVTVRGLSEEEEGRAGHVGLIFRQADSNVPWPG